MSKIIPLDKQCNKEPSLIPRHSFFMYVSASRGSGKSTMILNLLTRKEFFKGLFNKILFMSPTASLDKKVRILESDDITSKNTKLLSLIKKLKKRKEIMNASEKLSNFYESVEEDSGVEFYDTLDLDEIKDIISINRSITENYGKEFSNKVLIVIDDLIESKNVKSTVLKNLIFKSRHYNISVIISGQSYFALPKALRLNASQMIMFETGSKKEIDSFYEENNAGISFKDFYRLYREIIDIPYNFIVINYQNIKKYRIQSAFEEFKRIEY
jgi:hypothetical protein